ncbi:FAD-binding domain-containing protein [Cadophora sp. DSE1049]|nr:FAD-binding domain-containing protein [Cadophora sp. DSE1049]
MTSILVSAQECKCAPSEPCWPSTAEWDSLNNTISGRLIRSIPPGSVCYPSQPNFSKEACDIVLAGWSTNELHSSDPISIHAPVWANSSCNPIYPNGTSVAGDLLAGEKGCSIGAYPVYVVNVTDASDVQAAVRFVQRWNVRLNIKNTGHNGSGRLWTHNLKQFDFHENFNPQCAMKTTVAQMAATIGAGMQDGELFAAMAKHNAMGVGGTNADVGVVGWATGGGHGFMTGQYGMGADNILEATVVMPDSEILTANACQNTDLFWAVRGGGGGTFGIITSLTVKAYPMPQVTLLGLSILANNHSSSTAWWDLIARVHSLLPQFQDQGLHGYYSLTGPPSSGTFAMDGSFFVWDQPNGTAERITAPMKTMLDGANDTVTSSLFSVYMPTFEALVQSLPSTGRAGTVRNLASSRLISRGVLTREYTLFAQTLERIGPKSVAPVDGTPNPSLSGTMSISHKLADNALNPAWRDTGIHLITTQTWDDSLPDAQVKQIIDDMTYSKLNALRELDPGSGAYLNEANSFEPGWQWSFFGANYARLHEIKSKYDPGGMLWCPQCVGSEDWVQEEDGKLCRLYQPFRA